MIPPRQELTITERPAEVKRLTAPGRGAVAVVRVRSQNNECVRLDAHFRSVTNQRPSTAEIGRILYGHWNAEDVVVVRTAADAWEIHCHGGDAAVTRVCSDLGGLTSGHPENQHDLQSALTQTLLQCRTQQTAKYLLAQDQGVLKTFLHDVANVDSSADVRDRCRLFVARRTFAAHLSQPWNVTIAGRPNAGKSSLLNALVGFDRAIVFDQPGTTRDRIEADTFLQGWPFRMHDTAGIRKEVDDGIEAAGVESAQAAISDCDACLLVVDSVAGWTRDDEDLLARVQAGCPVVILWNKSDLTAVEPDSPSGVAVIRTSATQNTGIDTVTRWLCDSLIPEHPPFNEPLPVVPGLVNDFEDFLRTGDLRTLQKNVSRWLDSN